MKQLMKYYYAMRPLELISVFFITFILINLKFIIFIFVTFLNFCKYWVELEKKCYFYKIKKNKESHVNIEPFKTYFEA